MSSHDRVIERPDDDRRSLARWDRRRFDASKVACIGDSITSAGAGHPSLNRGIIGWADQLAAVLAGGQELDGGFRGLWQEEWTQSGTWNGVTRADPYDVAPFEQALFSSATAIDRLTWNKPAATTVASFDLYWFHMPGTGDWQFRIDDGRWQRSGAPISPADNALHKISVQQPIARTLDVRGFDGVAPCIAPIAGISTTAGASPAERAVVHKLAKSGDLLNRFSRESKGDPLALLDFLQPDLVTILFSNDTVHQRPELFGDPLRRLIERVAPYADVLVMAPFEQATQRSTADGTTIRGSNVLRSPSASFDKTDVWRRLAAPGITHRTVVAAVTSPESVLMSKPATETGEHLELKIGSPRTPELQAAYRSVAREVAASTGTSFLDLYEVWTDLAGAGWQAAYDHGLMADTLHPSQLGHDEIARRVLSRLGLLSN